MSILRELKELDTSRRALRKFGLVVGGVFLLIGLWFWFRQKSYFIWPLGIGIPLAVLGLLCPAWLRWIYLAWMGLAFVLGHVVSTLLLLVFYYLVVTPVGLLARCMGRDFLNRRIEPSAASYWICRDHAKPRTRKEYEQQF